MTRFSKSKKKLQDELEELRALLDESEARCAELEEELVEVQDTTAEEIVARAEADAAVIRHEAQRAAERILNQAEKRTGGRDGDVAGDADDPWVSHKSFAHLWDLDEAELENCWERFLTLEMERPEEMKLLDS